MPFHIIEITKISQYLNSKIFEGLREAPMAIFRHWRFFAIFFHNSLNVKHETASRRPAGPCLTFNEL